jgi:peptide/nickel transport system ATP-binding protein
VLEAEDVTVTFEGKGLDGSSTTVTACDRVSLSLAPGEIVALVGESGSGKTTLARAFGLFQDIDSGEIRLSGRAVRGSGRSRVRPRDYYGEVQMIFQDPFASLNHLKTIRHIIGRAVRLHSGLRGRRAVEERTLELLETVHLTPAEDYIDRYPSALSGGQRQRISIARALAVDPMVILADEPTSMLDVSIRIDVLNLLSELRREKGVAILYITHDIASARYISDRMAVMYKGSMVELGETEQVVLSPQHDYTKTLIAAAPDPGRRSRRRRRRGEEPFTA